MNNCKNCSFCKLDEDESSGVSIGGLLLNEMFVCSNPDSVVSGNKMSVITNLESKEKIDNREDSYCDKREPLIS